MEPKPPPPKEALLTLATRFAAGGCCGKVPTLKNADLEAVGLFPVPALFVATLGQIIPRSGWKAMCVYVYETLIKKPFPVPKDRNVEWGEIVSNALKEIA